MYTKLRHHSLCFVDLAHSTAKPKTDLRLLHVDLEMNCALKGQERPSPFAQLLEPALQLSDRQVLQVLF